MKYLMDMKNLKDKNTYKIMTKPDFVKEIGEN